MKPNQPAPVLVIQQKLTGYYLEDILKAMVDRDL